MIKMATNVEVDQEVRAKFPDLFGLKVVNGRKISVEDIIGKLTVELEGEIEAALTERRRFLNSREPVRRKYAIPGWEDKFVDPVDGTVRTFREIVQGLIDNMKGRDTPLAWRLNDTTLPPPYANPLTNPGLELTGPWHPLDMAVKQINADVSATMGPDDEDAAPPDYRTLREKEVGIFASRSNEHKILSGEVREVQVVKKGKVRRYVMEKPMEKWPTSFHRVPGMHLRTPFVKVNGRPAPSIIVDYVIHALNDFEPLRRMGRSLLFYQPKVQQPIEASVVAKIVWNLEKVMGASTPGEFIKFKALYEEANAGRFLPVIMWMWRHWLLGTNVGRWDYTASLIEMWKDERVLPDPQNGRLMGMVAPHMMAYQRYNGLLNLMAGLRDGDLRNAGAIGGMNAVMLYQRSDPYGRDRHNPVTLRSMWMDKMRERLIGLIFVPEGEVGKVTLEDVLSGKVKGKLYDLYRQSWVASPDREYVAAGNLPLRTPLERLQSLLDSPEQWEEREGKRVAPKVTSGLTQDERKLLNSLGLVDERGKITPWVLRINSPEEFLNSLRRPLWDALYDVKEGDVTVENAQHALYMAANYGFQVLNGNLAAAIDDYVLFPGRVVRFMNDLATYRIFVSWLWTLFQRGGRVTKDGHLMGPTMTDDGVLPAKPEVEVKAGTPFDRTMLERMWELHDRWTKEFFQEFDRVAAVRVVLSLITDDEELVGPLAKALLKSTEEASKLVGHPRAYELLSKVSSVKEVLSRAYGRAPTYRREITEEEAASEIGKILGVEQSRLVEAVRASAPMFDRSMAPVIMDVLRRQMLCPTFIQHSARVLFVIAGMSGEERTKVLDAIYYVNGRGEPVYRNERGEPSRERIVEAVRKGELPQSALEAHDYVYDIYEK